MPILPSDALEALVTLVLRRMGSSDEEAHEVADHLVRSSLSGHDSHGVGVLPGYVARFEEGLVVPNQTLRPLADSGAVLLFDAARGFGQRMAAEAVRAAIARARDLGACVVGLRNSAHIGRVGTYAEQCAEAGMAFTAFVNVADHQPFQAPWGCRDGRLGTNPFCAAVPGADGPALMLDIATTTIAYGKARVAHEGGFPVPEDAMIDAEGRRSGDPTDLLVHGQGALASFGRHKGSGLAVLCEALGAVLTGGQRADEPQRGGVLNSMLAVVIDVGRFGDPGDIAGGFEAIRTHVKQSRPAADADAILLPGEPERRSTVRRRQDGIPVAQVSWDAIRAAAARLGVTEAEIGQVLAPDPGR
ncbi:MAG TPA: malate/lactate/ureidoglycolate dehydrogenase [Acetobacteraceae bacterium]